MILSNHFVWAGLLILIVSGAHIFLQRKLMDKGTEYFLEIMVKGILICLLGIVLSSMRGAQENFDEQLYHFILSVRYFIQSTIPFEFFMLATVYLDLDENTLKRRYYIALLPLTISLAANIANVFTPVIAYADADRAFCRGPYFDVFFIANILFYAIICIYLIMNYRKLGRTVCLTLCEASLITMLGTIAQYYIQIQFFFGLSLALSLVVIHLTMKNSSTYIEKESGVFNSDYFIRYMKEKFLYKKVGCFIVIDMYQHERVKIIYGVERAEKYVAHICKQLWDMKITKEIFRLRENRIIIHTDYMTDIQIIAERAEMLFKTEHNILERNIISSALIVKMQSGSQYDSIYDVVQFIDFICEEYRPNSGTAAVDDNTAIRKEFLYIKEIEQYLHKAIKDDLFQVYYQPIYSNKEGTFTSVEALSRLKHPALGWIPPDKFIRIATESGQLFDIMPAQIRKICSFVRDNRKAVEKIGKIKINLSPVELVETGYCDKIINIIEEYELPCSLFQFEITEDTATKYTPEVEKLIRIFREKGLGLCLDDFGTGYANLNTILRMPFDTVKLDGTLLRGIGSDYDSAVIYSNTVGMLTKLGYNIVAECVETEKEALMLKKWGVDMIQGYYYSKPLSEKELLDFAQNVKLSGEKR